MSGFVRKATQMIRRLKTTNEGIQGPQTVAILESFDAELAALKKEVAALKKAK